ncbi:hypothetical protein BXZ70DRAFT_414420 [Cristinia sonorae]|uniref:AMP-activated protein kinase glycogen-binding domain-containing protein n=1 Tax=Cristinia sonorae TaxID=1940300 RepID=A0A8K0UXL4_9AGAR|nr:hypothetical protein BXZ70DRAFT_414420 [Cristinia sonorae]
MSSSDLHEATFKWPHTEPSEVIVTGSFDSWSRTIHLSRTPTGFAGVVKIPWGQKVTYKYIVDGRWTTTDTQPTELDPIGNINNTYNAPARPIQPKADAPPAVLAAPAVTAASAEPAAIVPTPVEPVPIEPAPVEPVPVQLDIETVGKANGVIASAKEAATAMVEAIAPGTTETPAETPIEETKTEPPIIESTTAAAKGASTTVTETTSSYVTAAVASVAAAVQAVSGAVAKVRLMWYT